MKGMVLGGRSRVSSEAIWVRQSCYGEAWRFHHLTRHHREMPKAIGFDPMVPGHRLGTG
jgi:hypothetical protein